MAKLKLILGLFIISNVFLSCDLSVPDKPNFTTSHTVEIPLLNNKTYEFIGGSSGALIDTTKEDLDSLFVIDPTSGLISITSDEDFDFGDLDDAIPEIDAPSTSFNSQIGEIEIGDFSSSGSGDLGSTNFSEISGGATPLAGTPVPPGDNSAMPVNIDIGSSSDFFTSATISDGSLDITVTNELGFDIQTLDITLLSNGAQVGTVASFTNLSDDATETASIVFSDGDELVDITVDVVVSWNGFTYPADDGDLIIRSASGNNLLASSVTAKLEPQDFSTTNTSTFNNTEFRFTDPLHYVELSGGQISVTNLVNNMGVGIETLQISFPDIRNGSFSAADSLVINFPTIPAGTNANDQNIDLTGFQIFAENNQVTYNIVAATVNTQSGPSAGDVIISETDQISASVDITGLAIREAFGEIVTQNVILGDNDNSNDTGSEVLDVFNDTEAEITNIEGLEDFSEQIDGFMFTDPTININYNTNIRIGTTIYAALVGIDGNGNEVYLSGKSGEDTEVTAADQPIIDGLVANGQQLQPNQLIKFSVDNMSDCQNNTCQISFNTTTTNVDEFLNNLPSSIRFVGKAVINEGGGEATITAPLEFDPQLNVDLPLAFSTEVGSPANFTDTLDLEIDLGLELVEGSIFINYSNNLPLGLNVFLSFQDSVNTEVFALPVAGEEIRLRAAPIDDMTGFSNASTDNSFIFTLTESELSLLNEVSFLEFSVNLRSSENKAVKLRASDSFTISLGARIKTQNEVNNN